MESVCQRPSPGGAGQRIALVGPDGAGKSTLLRLLMGIAQTYWHKAGLADRITLHLAPAATTLAALPQEPKFDLGFIDADKENGRLYYEEVLARLRPGEVLILDNALWGGKVVAPQQHPDDASLQAICALNTMAATDPRVQPAFLPLGDGLLLLRKR